MHRQDAYAPSARRAESRTKRGEDAAATGGGSMGSRDGETLWLASMRPEASAITDRGYREGVDGSIGVDMSTKFPTKVFRHSRLATSN